MEGMEKQTAVDWLEEYINKEINKYKIQPMDLHAIYALNHIKEFACSKAKEMEKQRLEQFYNHGQWAIIEHGHGDTFEDYYIKTFKSE